MVCDDLAIRAPMINFAAKFDVGAPVTCDSWSVLTVIRNTPYEVIRFVSWYLELGADRIFIVFHDPDDAFIPILQDHPKIQCIPFDPDLRIALGIGPEDPKPPQIQVGTYFYPHIMSDWLLRVDCDELVYCEGASLGERLAAVPDEIQTVVIRPSEQLISDLPAGQNLFRTVMTDEKSDAVYGPLAGLLKKRQGLMSHAFGKSAHRTGLGPLLVQEHNAIFPDSNARTRNQKWLPSSGVVLMHFNAEVFDKWKMAAQRRSLNSSFGPQLAAEIRACSDLEDGGERLRALYDGIVCFNGERRRNLLETGCGFVVSVDFDRVIEKHFDPGRCELRATST